LLRQPLPNQAGETGKPASEISLQGGPKQQNLYLQENQPKVN